MFDSRFPAGAGDMFLMVKGARSGAIKGESLDEVHKGEIEVLRWSWGLDRQASYGSGMEERSTSVRDLKIVKRVDAASTALMSALRANEQIQKAVLTLRKAGGSQLEYLTITIELGRVTSLTIEAGDEEGHAVLFEQVTFSFKKITVEYVPQGKDGQPQGSMQFTDQWSAD
ncbi:MAG: Hcp family type VI secretion system effector [Vicinamibacterales bacterium]